MNAHRPPRPSFRSPPKAGGTPARHPLATGPRPSRLPTIVLVLALVLGTRLALTSTPASAAPAPSAPSPPPEVVHVLDARDLRTADVRQPDIARRVWDTAHALAALQGIVNRDAPRLYVLQCAEFGVETDAFWLDWFRGEDGWLRSSRIVSSTSLVETVRTFRDRIRGLVVYDAEVPATANAASTAAGVEDLLPVRFSRDPDSLLARLRDQLGLPVKVWLTQEDGTPKFTGRGRIPDVDLPSSGSAKIDVHRWMVAKYLETGKADPRVACYALDAWWLRHPDRGAVDLHTLPNQDWFIARRALFFDLSPWGDEPPVDDPTQAPGLDRSMLLDLLRGLTRRTPDTMVMLGGFVPWPHKYTTHAGAGRHEPVPTEWEFARLVSQFNAYFEADAAGLGSIANASFNRHYPLADRYPQPNRPPDEAAWRAAGHLDAAGRVVPRLYLGHYVGDYDAPSWLYKAVPAWARDPARGRVPLGWAFNPNLADRAPQALVYAYRHATSNDWFIAGDSGAGYLNARALTHRPDSGLPPALDLWARHCRPYFERWGMTITGFVLDGAAGASNEAEFAAYRGFSPDGCGTHFEKGARMIAGIPTCPEKDLPDSAEAAAAFIARQAARHPDQPRFLWARSILKSPSWYAEVSRRLREQHPDAPVAVVDPYTFFGLIRRLP